MNESTRRGVAYIAGRALAERNSSAVYDYDAGEHFFFGGTLTRTQVSVYDYDKRCYITGSGNGQGFALFHYGNGGHISLMVETDSFNGFDYDSSSHFSGKVNGSVVWVFDYEHSEWSSYSI